MKLIVLKGKENTGKTTTINCVCNDLRGKGYIEPSSKTFEDLGNAPIPPSSAIFQITF